MSGKRQGRATPVHFEEEDFATDDQGITLFNRGNRLEQFQTAECRPWLEMCAAVDRKGDFQPLLDLLHEQGIAPAKVLPFLQDLFERHGLLKHARKSKARTPLYELSGREALLSFACEDVRDLVRGGRVSDDVEPPPDAERFSPGKAEDNPDRMKVGDAVALVAERYHDCEGISEDAIAKAYAGKDSGMQRMSKRLKKRQTPTR